MSRTMDRRPRAAAGGVEPKPRFRRGALVAVAAVALLVVAALAFAGSSSEADGTDAFEATGTAMAGGVEVVGAEIAMGKVPLDVTVVPTWVLTNTGSEPVTLGQPHASVIEGCCPGPLLLSAVDLAPGESAQLTFPLQMHAGMDGPHDFDIHVPVGDEHLTLGVTGDFRG